jgi:hypothetical protein
MEAVSIRVTHLHAESSKTLLSSSTVSMDLTVPLAHVVLTFMALGTDIVRTSGGDSHASLLRSGHSGKTSWAGTFYISTIQGALCIGTTCSILFTRIYALEVDACFIRGTVAVGPATNLTDSGATDLTSRALLAGNTGDVTHAVCALFSHETIIGVSASKHALAIVASRCSTVSAFLTSNAVSDAGPAI